MKTNWKARKGILRGRPSHEPALDRPIPYPSQKWSKERRIVPLLGPARRRRTRRASLMMVCFVATLAIVTLNVLHAADEPPFGIERRIPWTTSRLVGSPDPPLRYTVERTFTNLEWKLPIFITAEPGTDRLFVILQGGETNKPSRILQLHDDPNTAQVETFLALSNRLVYSLAFHPGYHTNGYIFVFSNGTTSEQQRTNRISRYFVARHPPFRCDPESAHPIIEWHSQGHDGGGLVFGNDGLLYISSGDGSSDSDDWVTGQDLSGLNGGILRIDVDRADATQPYAVPKDNPFVGRKDARPEKWAYGLRNPWRLTVDPKSGQIWVGNNGQDLWETAHLVGRGENYGWSVYEGSHPFYLNRRLGPTPVVLPTIEHSHSEARSLTGGVVYRGAEFPDLDGVYVYGDYSTGKIWGMRHDGKRVTWHHELADTELQITAFVVDQRGQLLIADHAGNICRLVRSPKQSAMPTFPTRLSETGLFASTRAHQVQPGVIPYSVNAPAWADGASAERFIALPDDTRLDYSSTGSWNLTNGAVLVQTLSLEREAGHAASRQRLETRLLTRQSGQWVGYSYRWDDAQSDATLVQKTGGQKEFVIQDPRAPGGVRRQVWHYPGRAECSACHSRAANFVLGLTEQQMNRVHDYGGVKDNQLRTLRHLGLFTNSLPKSLTGLTVAYSPSPPSDSSLSAKVRGEEGGTEGGEAHLELVNPYDVTQSLEARARSYLHANCSVCHVGTGGGNSKMILSFSTKADDMNVIGARPQHDTFGINNAMLVAPGDPDRSILLQRLSRRGRGQMPPVVIATVDEQAVALFREWIRAMKSAQQFVRDWTMDDLLPKLEQAKQGRSFDSGKAAFKLAGCGQCHRFAGDVGSVGPDLTGAGQRLSLHDLLESIVLPSKVIVEGYAATEIETKSGEISNGRIVREDDQVVVVLPQTATLPRGVSASTTPGVGRPATPQGEDAITIRKTDIRRRELSKVSNMPAGILNTLQETQILDLLAYVISDGSSNHVAFGSGAAAIPSTK
ncbi:MAG: PQQ-dependent sugar dehydrogenase [Verrucomicrobia bacterium]|nr:PQQ-dependent sugar dehydrogenase [Verrucomicrobiota bacterium]